jgi:hypothetical protein|tara:strand:- start:1212 stop:1442 length:231 start_codon:yes stop_codon:yes gene_type:complete
MINKAIAWCKQITELGMAIIALGVVMQIIFGATVPFLGIDLVGSIVSIVSKLGGEGLVGLVAVWILWGIFSREAPK